MERRGLLILARPVAFIAVHVRGSLRSLVYYITGLNQKRNCNGDFCIPLFSYPYRSLKKTLRGTPIDYRCALGYWGSTSACNCLLLWLQRRIFQDVIVLLPETREPRTDCKGFVFWSYHGLGV